jgi:hypothetical protein
MDPLARSNGQRVPAVWSMIDRDRPTFPGPNQLTYTNDRCRPQLSVRALLDATRDVPDRPPRLVGNLGHMHLPTICTAQVLATNNRVRCASKALGQMQTFMEHAGALRRPEGRSAAIAGHHQEQGSSSGRYNRRAQLSALFLGHNLA